MKEAKTIAKLVVLLAFVVFASGCAHMITAFENAELQTHFKMSDTIFLDPQTKAKNKTVFVATANTSELQEVDTAALQKSIEEKLANKGYSIVNNPNDAGYIIQVNILNMDYAKVTGTHEGALEGALTGAGIGAILGNSRDTSTALGLAVGVIGGIGGAIIGKAIKVETYIGAVDVQIQEKTDNIITGQIVTNAPQGTATTLQTKQDIQTNYQTYRTRMIATLKQTNLDRQEAAKVAIEKIATQIASLF